MIDQRITELIELRSARSTLIDQWRDREDVLIRSLHRDGWGYQRLAAALGITKPGAQRLVGRARTEETRIDP